MNPDPLRDPDTDSEPWPVYEKPRSGFVLVYVFVALLIVVLALAVVRR